jgi:hypothetical protein
MLPAPLNFLMKYKEAFKMGTVTDEGTGVLFIGFLPIRIFNLKV